MAIPIEIIGLGKNHVRFVWEDDRETKWTAQALRRICNCAHCKSEFTGERILDPNTVAEDLCVTHMEHVGNYGLSIHFSDGHTTGIYRFRDLSAAPEELTR